MSAARRTLAGLTLAASLASEPAQAAQAGVRGGYYADAGEPFAGAEIVFRVSERVQVAPSVEVLAARDGHFVNASLDTLLALDCACNPASRVWAGAGLALISRGDGSDTALTPGLDLLLGFGVRAGGLVPYAQIKAILKDRPEVVVGVGLRF